MADVASLDVLVAEDVWGHAFDRLAQRLTVDYQPELWEDRRALIDRTKKASALVVRNRARVDEELLRHAPNLRVVARAGAGLDNIDLAAADAAGVVVVAARGVNARSVAEHTLALALALARGIVVRDRAARNGAWDRAPGIELADRTWGLLGAGATGQAVARLVSCVGARVLGYDTALSPDDPCLLSATIELVSLDRLIDESDVISIHLPATPATHNLVNRAFLRRMRAGAFLINVGRGEVVDEAALANALVAGEIAGAGLDVRSSEPPTTGILETLDNVVLTPHVAGITHESQDRIVTLLADDLERLFSDVAALNAVGSLTRPAAAKEPPPSATNARA